MGRVRLLLAMIGVLGVAASATGQTARAIGTVRDTDGKPIKGATIRATNPDAHPREVVSASDDKGRWAVIGLRIGMYEFTVEAPGFLPVKASTTVRTAASPPLQFTLARDPGPIPGALPGNIQAQLAAANMLRDQGRLDQAITAYHEIRVKNPKLTYVNLVLGDMYRARAAGEADPALRRAMLDRAIESYNELLKADAGNERARRELDLAAAEVRTLAR